MTLIEVLVALVLLSLLSTGMLTIFRVGERSYRQVVRVDKAEWSNVVAQRFVRRVIESAYPFEPSPGVTDPAFGLEGTFDRLRVSAPAFQGMGTVGLERYEFHTTLRPDGLVDLKVRTRVDRNGQAGTAGDADAGRSETLVERAASVEWSYFDTGESDQWAKEWTDRRRLPALVRLSIAFPKGDGREWPDLVAALRITDDANCEFDFVRQDCREPQP